MIVLDNNTIEIKIISKPNNKSRVYYTDRVNKMGWIKTMYTDQAHRFFNKIANQ